MIEVLGIRGDEYMCRCPFHKGGRETNPSLQVNTKKNAAICFAGCYEGSATELIAKALQIPKQIAYLRMMDGTWCDIISTSHTGSKYANLSSSSAAPVKWVPAYLNPYLLNRGFSRSTIVFWGIMYSEQIKHIRFPIHDIYGKLISYSYRTIEPGIEPKYIHPGFYKKLGHLFGEFQTEDDKLTVYLVEGALDAIWLWQHGYKNALAFLGGPTEEQISRVPSFGANIKICTDGDDGGRLHAKKVVVKFKEMGTSFSLVQFPEGKDPQDMNADELHGLLKY
jgi:DNA primase